MLCNQRAQQFPVSSFAQLQNLDNFVHDFDILHSFHVHLFILLRWPKTIFVLKSESLHAGFCNPLNQSVVWRYVLIHLVSNNFIKMKKRAKTTKTWAVDKCQKSKAGKTWPAQRWVVFFGRWAGLNFSHLPSEPVATIPSRPIPDQSGTRPLFLLSTSHCCCFLGEAWNSS